MTIQTRFANTSPSLAVGNTTEKIRKIYIKTAKAPTNPNYTQLLIKIDEYANENKESTPER